MLVDSPQTAMIAIDPRLYCETMNELHSYITSSKRGYLTQAELFRYYRQRHDNAEIPYRLLGYRCLLDLLSSDQRLFSLDLRREPACIYSAVKVGAIDFIVSDVNCLFVLGDDVQLRQERRDRQCQFEVSSLFFRIRIGFLDGPTSFSRQHHSTNTLDEPQNNNDDLFFVSLDSSFERALIELDCFRMRGQTRSTDTDLSTSTDKTHRCTSIGKPIGRFCRRSTRIRWQTRFVSSCVASTCSNMSFVCVFKERRFSRSIG